MHGSLPSLRKLSWRERLTGVSRPGVQASFLRNLDAPAFFGWQPTLRQPSDEYRSAYYEVARRAIDAIHNSGWLAGGIEQAANQMVGAQLSLNARPDPMVFGGDLAGTRAWARDVEARFNAWAASEYSVDFRSVQNLGQMCTQSVKSWFGYGEIFAIIQYAKLPGQATGTKVQMIPPTRCPQTARDMRATQGIYLDRAGRPLAYAIETVDPRDPFNGIINEVPVRTRDRTGRRIVVHIHDSPPTVLRGITPLAPALQVVRQFDQLANATLTAALIQAIFAATIESDAPTDQLLAAMQDVNEQDASEVAGGGLDALMQAKTEWYKRTNIDLGTFGKVVHLFMGEKLDFKRSEHPNDNYQAFARHLLLEIARCLGITYEQLTGDWREATYTSGRMGAAENWLTNLYRRKHIAGPFMSAVYTAWLEEQIELGLIPFPGGIDGFIAQRDMAAQADWRGPPKPSADDYKTAKANETKLNNKVITREMWSAEEGVDYDDVFEQLSQEQERAEELDLDLMPAAAQDSPGGGKRPAQDSPDAERNNE